MVIGRRAVMRALGGAALAGSGLSALGRRASLAQSEPVLALRKVRLADAESLAAMMNACVSDADAFHGKCDTWSLRWATLLIRRQPDTVVISQDGVPVAFHEVPSIRPPIEPPTDNAPKEEHEQYERERSRRTFSLTAVGVDADRLAPDDAVRMFRRMLFYGFQAAAAAGFEEGEGIFPWVHHPKMARAWTDYPGCELITASESPVDGRHAYWLRWRLPEAIEALALEGADDEPLALA